MVCRGEQPSPVLLKVVVHAARVHEMLLNRGHASRVRHRNPRPFSENPAKLARSRAKHSARRQATCGYDFNIMSTPEQAESAVLPNEATLSVWERMRKALGPAIPSITLDLFDAMSLTRVAGPFVSFPVGLVIGIWLSSYYRFSWGWKTLIAVGSGLYTLTPGTEAIPLATILTCLGRFVATAPDATANESNPSQTESTANEATELTTTSTANLPAATLMDSSGKRTNRTGAKCPECESMSLKYGQVGQRFWPTECSAWSKGHEVNAFVCLDCGFVGHFLSAADLESLG